jgi:hypothetical protein
MKFPVRNKKLFTFIGFELQDFFFRALIFNISGLNLFCFFRVFQYTCVSMIIMDHHIHLNELMCAHSVESRLTASST